MDINAISQLIGSLGFPIVCVIGLGWFIFKIWNKTFDSVKKEMTEMRDRCQVREDKLYEQIDKFNITMNNFNSTLIRIDTRLEEVEKKLD